MFLLSLKEHKDEGAFAVEDSSGDKVLFLFEQEEDAERYAMQLHEQDEAEMAVVEFDGKVAIKTCRMYNYKYAIITPNDIVMPPRSNDNLPED